MHQDPLLVICAVIQCMWTEVKVRILQRVGKGGLCVISYFAGWPLVFDLSSGACYAVRPLASMWFGTRQFYPYSSWLRHLLTNIRVGDRNYWLSLSLVLWKYLWCFQRTCLPWFIKQQCTYPPHCRDFPRRSFLSYPWISLRWRHNERDSVSNHQPRDCLLNRLFRRRSK